VTITSPFLTDDTETTYIDVEPPTPESPEPRIPEQVDPEAPFGRSPTGKPYRQPKEEREAIGRKLAAARAAKSSTTRKPTTPPRKSGATSRSSTPIVTDYRPSLTALLQIPIGILGVLGRRNEAFAYDGAALHIHGPGLIQAVQETAEQDARVAALLDRVVSVGPYGALVAALVPIALQIAHNHGAMPAAPELGVYSREQLLEELERRTASGV
jgi:hypothetical protein